MTGIALLVANMVPLYGVFAWDWQVFPIILLYWLENLIMGGLQMVKLAALPAPQGTSALAAHASKLFILPFFTVHYGMFCAVHGVFVFSVFQDDSDVFGHRTPSIIDSVTQVIERAHLMPALIALALSHGFSMVRHFFLNGGRLQGENPVGALMGSIYARVIVLHITILIGGAVAMFLGSPKPALVLLIVLKCAFDYAAHKREHAMHTVLQTTP